MAVCLWAFRKGIGIETTCKANGWSEKSIWNSLRLRNVYKRYAQKRKRKWPDKRKYGKNYSVKFPLEAVFKSHVIGILRDKGFTLVEECRLPGARTRVDIRLSDGTYIECKVAFNSGQLYEFIGQAVHYRKFTHRVVLCAPEDVEVRKDLFDIILELGVEICNPTTILDLLNGNPCVKPAIQTAMQRNVFFVCKCCGSREKRRHRNNSYCVDCVSEIPHMCFDYRQNRWLPKTI